jgi:hypothetical protein
MTTTFEQAQHMVFTGECFSAPEQYLALINKLTMAQRIYLLQGSDSCLSVPNPWGENLRHLCGGRKRRPGGGRKRLGTQPEYVDTLKQVVVMQSPTSPLAYSTQSARSIAGVMKQHGHSCAPGSIPNLVGAIGLRTHNRIEPSPRIKSVNPADQFDFIGRRLEHILSKDTGTAWFITADPQPKTPCNCPANRLEAWRGQAIASHVQEFLTSRADAFAKRNINELMLIVEGGGLLGLRNKNLHRSLQFFAGLTGITVFLSHLPPGLSRIATDVLADEMLELTREKWNLGTVHLRIGEVKTSSPSSNPQGGNFRSSSWNRIFRPVTLDTNPTDDNRAAPSCYDIHNAAVDSDATRRYSPVP